MNKLFSLPEDQLRQLIKESVKDNISEGIGDRLFGGSGGRDAPRRTSRYGTRSSGATTQAGIGGGRGRAQMAGRSIITTIEQLRPAMAAAKIDEPANPDSDGKPAFPHAKINDVVGRLESGDKRTLADLMTLSTREVNNWIGRGDDILADIWRDIWCMAQVRVHKVDYDKLAASGADANQLDAFVKSNIRGKCANHWLDDWNEQPQPPGVDPPPPVDPDDPEVAQDDSPVPIFKDMTDEEGKKLGAKAGGQGLQALLQNWINKNAPEGLDRKALQAAIRQIVQDVADQLKANKIPVQESKQYIKEELINVLLEGPRAERGQGKKALRKKAAIAKQKAKELAAKQAAAAKEPAAEPAAAEPAAEPAAEKPAEKPLEGSGTGEGEQFLKPRVLMNILKDIRQATKIPFDTASVLNALRDVIKSTATSSTGAKNIRMAGGPKKKKPGEVIPIKPADKDAAAKQKAAEEEAMWSQQKMVAEAAATPAVVRISDLHKAVMNNGVYSDGPNKGKKLSPDHAQAVVIPFAEYLEKQKGANITVDRGQEADEQPEEKPEQKGQSILDIFKGRLKELDLDSTEGRKAALEDDQTYLGAYMFYKAMVKVLKALGKKPDASIEELIKLAPKELGGTSDIVPGGQAGVQGTYRAGSPYSPKRKGAIKEGLLLEQVEALLEEAANAYLIKMLQRALLLQEQQYSHQTTPEATKWLQDYIKYFKIAGLADGDRAVKASKAARGVKDPKEKGYEPDVQAKEGELNTAQSIAPRLKQAGIDIKSPEGKELTKNLLRLVRRFTDRHFGRLKVDTAKGGKESAANTKKIQDKINLLRRRGQDKEAKDLERQLKHTVQTTQSYTPGQQRGAVTEEMMTEITLRILGAILSNKNLIKEVKRRTLFESRGYSFTNETDQDHSAVEKLAGNLYPYLKKQLKFNRDASIRLVSDPENGKNPLGKTAYYDPSSYAVTIYADNRHPKDILRSFSHEMVHHSQNCQGNFDNTVVGEQGYAQNDSHLREMERQAYEVGNLAFRDWEDGMKSAMMERIQAKLAEKSQVVDQPKLKLALKEAINKDSLTKALFTG